MEDRRHSAPRTPRIGGRSPRRRTLRPREGRRVLAPLAGIAFAAAPEVEIDNAS